MTTASRRDRARRAAPTPHPNQFALLRQRRFAPFFWTQFAGAANDNLFKFAFTVMVTYQLQVAWLPPAMAGLVIGALFILPFLLFSATSGQLADKYDKRSLIRFVKWLEIAHHGAWRPGASSRANVPILLACTFLMGLHSTLFGPVKFAYLPQHLDERELTGGNGMVEMGTFVAILLGNVAGGLLVAVPQVGPQAVGIACIALALVGRAGGAVRSRRRRRPTRACAINWNPFTETWRNLKLAHGNIGGVPLAAGHQLDVVLRRRVPQPVPELRQGGAARQRAGGLAAAGGVLRRHRRRLAAVRDAVAPARGDRPGAAGRHRHDACSRSTCTSPRAACRRRPRLTLAPVPGRSRAHWRVMADLALLSLVRRASTACRCTR